METTSSLRNSPWLRGVIQAFPIVMGYIPIGFAFGVLAQKAGLSVWHALAMSVFVFAGSSQLIAVGLMAAGAAPLSIIITTFIVNLRHMLMSAAVSPHLKGWRKRELAAFAYELTDETFAVHSANFARSAPSKPEVFMTNVTSQLSWVLGSWLGVTMGQLIQDVRPYGLDYALAAMFIALLVVQLNNGVQVAVAVAAGILSLGFRFAGMEQWHVIAATMVAAAIGVVVEEWRKKKSSI